MRPGEPAAEWRDSVWPVLDRYLAGKMRPGDVPVLRCWLSETPQAREQVAALDQVLRAPVAYPRLADADALWGRLAARLQVEPRRDAHQRWRVSGWMSAVGALAAACIIASVVVWRPSTSGRAVVALARGAPSRSARDTTSAPDALAVAGDVGGVAPESATSVALAAPSETPTRVAARQDSLDVARSPYAGTPLDGAAGGGSGPHANPAMSVADAEPGAADTHWP
jgi:hypothetical protein